MNFKKIFNILLVLLISITTANAAAGLNVILANQNPDPVSPGNFVFLNVKISNIGNDIIKVNDITFIPNQYFKLAPGETASQTIGLVSPFSVDASDSFVIAKYKILVDDNTPLGLNTANFVINTQTGTFSYEFDVLVQETNPIIYVKNIETNQIKPGENSQLKINIENLNTINLQNVKIALDLASVEDHIITMNTGSNEKILEYINAKKEETFTFDIAISPEAASKSYLLPLVITFEDSLGNTYENTVYGSVKVYSKPDLSLKLDSQDIYTIGRGKFSLAIANPGTSKIKGVELNILPSNDYEIIEGTNQYIGDLNPDDFQTIQGDIYIKNNQSATLKIQLSYADSYDIKTQETIEIPLKIYNEEELSLFGFTPQQNIYTKIILPLLIVLLILLFFWRKHKKKRNLKHARET